MNTFLLKNENSINVVIKFLFELDFSKAWVIEFKEYREKRTLSQNSLFHKWVGELSKYLISKGRSEWTEKMTKDGLKHTFLGYEDVERVDMSTGVIRVSSELRHTSDLKTPEMYFFMQQVEHWAIDKGCFLTIPQKCEYRELQEAGHR